MAAPAADAPAPNGLDRVASSTGFNLNLSGVDSGMVAGEQSLEAGEFLMSARATSEVPLTVRGAAKARAQQLCALTPATLGSSRVKAAWRPGGAMIAVASEKDDGLLVQTFSRDGKLVDSHTLGPGKPIWCDWDSSGSSLAILQENVGLFLWDVPGPDTPPGAPATQPLKLCPSITVAASFCMWSKKHPQLAIGTGAGKVIVFNKAEGVMQLHDKKGKHGAAIGCGDWLFDNRLGLASGNRVKISKPLVEKGAKWESHSKFKLSGMLSRVPKKFKDAGAPRMLSFSLKSPTFVAVCIGDNYMLVFGTSNQHSNEDVGLTFPEDYGPIASFQRWYGTVCLGCLGYLGCYLLAYLNYTRRTPYQARSPVIVHSQTRFVARAPSTANWLADTKVL